MSESFVSGSSVNGNSIFDARTFFYPAYYKKEEQCSIARLNKRVENWFLALWDIADMVVPYFADEKLQDYYESLFKKVLYSKIYNIKFINLSLKRSNNRGSLSDDEENFYNKYFGELYLDLSEAQYYINRDIRKYNLGLPVRHVGNKESILLAGDDE